MQQILASDALPISNRSLQLWQRCVSAIITVSGEARAAFKNATQFLPHPMVLQTLGGSYRDFCSGDLFLVGIMLIGLFSRNSQAQHS